MDTRNLLIASAAACVLALPAGAAVPSVDSKGRPAQIKCGTSATGKTIFAEHSDKIIFQLANQQLQAIDPADQQALNQVPRDTDLDVKLRDNPKTVADLKGKLLSFLGAVDGPEARAAVRILDVEYAMVCPSA